MPQRLFTSRRKIFDDEFYTTYRDAVRELHKWDLREKKIICPCDTRNSNIYKYLRDCYYDVTCDWKEWRNIDYSKYDLVVTGPPFMQVNEFVNHLIDCKVDFIILVSDVFRYKIEYGYATFGIPFYKGTDAQKFIRPDGNMAPVHCIWLSNIPDTWGQNKKIGDKYVKVGFLWD